MRLEGKILAGSVLPMNVAARNLVNFTGLAWTPTIRTNRRTTADRGPAGSRIAPEADFLAEAKVSRVVRHEGIEPSFQAWEAHVLPIN